MKKSDKFSKELLFIRDSGIRNSCMRMLDLLPDYFLEVPASSTGKYHPKYALGTGGLMRHSKAAARIGHELLEDPSIGDKYTSKEKDLMIMGLLLHDGLKSGMKKVDHTVFEHPLLMADYILENKDKLEITEDEVKFVCDVIKTHMGPWITNHDGVDTLEKPKTKYQNFVHMCDYLASRKFLEVPFDDNNDILY